jgi:hypothetical protein
LAAVVICLALLFLPGHANAVAPEQPELVQPVLENTASIEYPPELLELDPPPAGEVIVKLVVGTDGVPKELEVMKGVHPQIDALALDAVATLRYEPATWGGRPVEVVTRIALEIGPPELPPEPKPPPPDEADKTPPGGDEGVEYAPEEEEDEGPLRIRGTIVEAGQRTPVEGASIVAVPAPPGLKRGRIKKKIYEEPKDPPWSARAITDAEGGFELRGIPDGNVRVIVLTQGFERLEFVETLAKGEEITVKYYQTRLNTNPYRTVVRATREEREEVARRTITVEEINALPGTQGDALKSIQNFPGIARSPFGMGLLIIRGSAPQDSAIYLAHHEIPQLFHFGGLTSVFNSDILAQIDYIPGNFDSRYGDATGGVVNVVPRKGRRDGYHGYVDSDLFDTGVLFEGPIGKGSFVLSGRRSYIDFLLPVFIPDDAGLNMTIAPRYYDYQALFDYPVSGGDLTVRVFGSDDRTKLVASDPNDVEVDDRNNFETTLFFHRADLSYRKREGPWEFLVTPSYRYDSVSLGVSDFFRFDIRSHLFSGRAELSRRLTKRLAWRIGTETLVGHYTFDAQAPPVPGEEATGGTGEEFATTQGDSYAVPAVYTTLSIGLGDKLTLYPGVRYSYYTGGPFDRGTTDPRLRFAWNVVERTTIKGGVGLYSRMPDPPEFDAVWGNPRIGPERSLHTEKIVRRPNGQIGLESFANDETGRVYGAELLARKDLTGNLFGWLSYTLMRSERQHAPGEDFVPFDFDQTHILTLILVYKLPKHWQVGGRFRLVSGTPYTPILKGEYNYGSGNYFPIEGVENSARMPVFHQLDLRVDKRWIWRRISLGVYLDVQNVYNRQNTEFFNYNYDFSEKSAIPSLPIIPSIGMKLEF